jgi:phage-related protein
MVDPRLALIFWRSETGREPVREWLSALAREDKQRIGTDLLKVQLGWPVGMPMCRPLSDGLFELRTSLSGRREARVLFGVRAGQIRIVDAFLKKTRATPLEHLRAARKRLENWNE